MYMMLGEQIFCIFMAFIMWNVYELMNGKKHPLSKICYFKKKNLFVSCSIIIMLVVTFFVLIYFIVIIDNYDNNSNNLY